MKSLDSFLIFMRFLPRIVHELYRFSGKITYWHVTDKDVAAIDTVYVGPAEVETVSVREFISIPQINAKITFHVIKLPVAHGVIRNLLLGTILRILFVYQFKNRECYIEVYAIHNHKHNGL